ATSLLSLSRPLRSATGDSSLGVRSPSAQAPRAGRCCSPLKSGLGNGAQASGHLRPHRQAAQPTRGMSTGAALRAGRRLPPCAVGLLHSTWFPCRRESRSQLDYSLWPRSEAGRPSGRTHFRGKKAALSSGRGKSRRGPLCEARTGTCQIHCLLLAQEAENIVSCSWLLTVVPLFYRFARFLFIFGLICFSGSSTHK
ncbi:unnamed protein product, partial [Urochloa humidicola]